jgi:hypothetical protein
MPYIRGCLSEERARFDGVKLRCAVVVGVEMCVMIGGNGVTKLAFPVLTRLIRFSMI